MPKGSAALVGALLVPTATLSGDELSSRLWRQGLADHIRTMYEPCEDVRSATELGFENDGRVIRVVCEVGRSERVLRIVFYTDGDISVQPWTGN